MYTINNIALQPNTWLPNWTWSKHGKRNTKWNNQETQNETISHPYLSERRILRPQTADTEIHATYAVPCYTGHAGYHPINVHAQNAQHSDDDDDEVTGSLTEMLPKLSGVDRKSQHSISGQLPTTSATFSITSEILLINLQSHPEIFKHVWSTSDHFHDISGQLPTTFATFPVNIWALPVNSRPLPQHFLSIPNHFGNISN